LVTIALKNKIPIGSNPTLSASIICNSLTVVKGTRVPIAAATTTLNKTIPFYHQLHQSSYGECCGKKIGGRLVDTVGIVFLSSNGC
jgi:hypothetical protein